MMCTQTTLSAEVRGKFFASSAYTYFFNKAAAKKYKSRLTAGKGFDILQKRFAAVRPFNSLRREADNPLAGLTQW